MIDADYLTPEQELQQLVRTHAGYRSDAEARAAYRYTVTYREQDPFDSTEDAIDIYVGYGSTYEEARLRAYGQSYAAEREHVYLEGMEAGS